jgi:hypothetical protein
MFRSAGLTGFGDFIARPTLIAWSERAGGADFHVRYLLTDVGGMNVEAGFSAEGAHQKVQLGLLPLNLAQNRLNALVRTSDVYDLIGLVLEVKSDGTVHRIRKFERWAKRQALGFVGQRV